MPTTANFPDDTVLGGVTWDQFVNELFDSEYCADCHGDVKDHTPWIILGNWFAHCKQPLAAGIIVESQDGNSHRGYVLDEPHGLDGWVWVQWDHIGRWAEAIEDITVVLDDDGCTARKGNTEEDPCQQPPSRNSTR